MHFLHHAMVERHHDSFKRLVRDLSSNSSSASNFMCDPGIRYLTILGLSFPIHEMGMTSALLQRDAGMLLDRKAR